MDNLPPGWRPHDGGPCPVPLDSIVDVMWPNGSVSRRSPARLWTAPAGRYGIDFWAGQHPVNRIIAYKPEEPTHDDV